MQLLVRAQAGEVTLQQAEPLGRRRDLDVGPLDLLTEEVDLPGDLGEPFRCGVAAS